MSRIKKILSKQAEGKIKYFLDEYKDNEKYYDKLVELFSKIVLEEKYLLKECSEAVVVDNYILTAKELINDDIDVDEFFDELCVGARKRIASKYTNNIFDNNIDRYFNEVKRQYIEHPVTEQDNIEFNEENRDIFIKNNLKLVIECAKRYQGLGMPLEDLIQAGNVGLIKAFDKFDKNKANLRINIIHKINAFGGDIFSNDDARSIISECFKYPKKLEETINKLPDDGFSSKNDFIEWVNKHIPTPVFASVAFMWIRSEIINKLNKYSKIVKVSKKNKEEGGSITFINLDSLNPRTNDEYHDNQISEIANEEFMIYDNKVENDSAQEIFKNIIKRELSKLPNLNRRVLSKRYGIDLPYSATISEIAESEALNHNKVKMIIANSLAEIKNNLSQREIDIIKESL